MAMLGGSCSKCCGGGGILCAPYWETTNLAGQVWTEDDGCWTRYGFAADFSEGVTAISGHEIRRNFFMPSHLVSPGVVIRVLASANLAAIGTFSVSVGERNNENASALENWFSRSAQFNGVSSPSHRTETGGTTNSPPRIATHELILTHRAGEDLTTVSYDGVDVSMDGKIFGGSRGMIRIWFTNADSIRAMVPLKIHRVEFSIRLLEE